MKRLRSTDNSGNIISNMYLEIIFTKQLSPSGLRVNLDIKPLRERIARLNDRWNA